MRNFAFENQNEKTMKTIRISVAVLLLTATVSPDFNSFTTTLTGRLVPFAESDVFKGRAL